MDLGDSPCRSAPKCPCPNTKGSKVAPTLYEAKKRTIPGDSGRLRSQASPASPIVVEVEPTTACNLACAFCPRGSLRRPEGWLSEGDFLSILENLGDPPDKGMLLFSGFGEPLQHESLAVFVRHAKQAGWFCGITTNGTRLSEPSAEGLVFAGLDVLQVSLHAVTDATYRRVVKRGSFDEVVNRVQSILPVCENTILLALNFTVTPWNREEIRDFASYWRERGISHINFSPCHNRGGHFRGLPRASSLPASLGRVQGAGHTEMRCTLPGTAGSWPAATISPGRRAGETFGVRRSEEIREKEKGRSPCTRFVFLRFPILLVSHLRKASTHASLPLPGEIAASLLRSLAISPSVERRESSIKGYAFFS